MRATNVVSAQSSPGPYRARGAFGLAAFALVACGGPTHQQWDDAHQTIANLREELDVVKAERAEQDAKYAEAQREIAELQDKLRVLGGARSTIEIPPSTSQDAPAPPGTPMMGASDADYYARAASAAVAPTAAPTAATTTTPTSSPGNNGGGPTLCEDGTVSGSSGRGTCSHHGGEAGRHHRGH